MIGKLAKGKGARGLVSYLLGERDHNGDVRERVAIVGGTLTGRDEHALIAEFSHLHRLRPRLGIHVAHQSLRLAPEDRRLSDDEWLDLASEWSRSMGFESFVIVAHGDDHVHVAASRVRLDGGVVSDSHDWRRSEEIVRRMEERFGLTRIDASHLLEPERATTHRKAPDMVRIGMAERGLASPAEQLADIIETTLNKPPTTVSAFVEALESAGVVVRPNLASTGRLNGFAYGLDGQALDAKALGRGYTLSNLMKRGLNYEPGRDAAALNASRTRAADGHLGRPHGSANPDAIGNPGTEHGTQRSAGADPGGSGDRAAAPGPGDGGTDRRNAEDPGLGGHQSDRRTQGGSVSGAENVGIGGSAVLGSPDQSPSNRSVGGENGSVDDGAGRASPLRAGDSGDRGGYHPPAFGGMAGGATDGDSVGSVAEFLILEGDDPDAAGRFLRRWAAAERRRQADATKAAHGSPAGGAGHIGFRGFHAFGSNPALSPGAAYEAPWMAHQGAYQGLPERLKAMAKASFDRYRVRRPDTDYDVDRYVAHVQNRWAKATDALDGERPALRRLMDFAGLPPGERHEATVRAHLAALGGEKFEIGVLPPKGDTRGLRPHRTRTWDAEGVVAALGWLRRQNALGFEIYVRPARLADDMCRPTLLLDDLTSEKVQQLRQDGYEPAAVVETSAGNFQAWIRIGDEPIAREEATEASRHLADQYDGDPGAVGWLRYGRLGGFTNQKPTRRQANGFQPFCQLREAAGILATKGADLVEWVRSLIFERAERAARMAALEQQRQRDTARFRRPGDLTDAVSAFLEIRSRIRATKQDGTPDESRRDFGACVRLLEHHHPDQVGAALRQASPNLQKRHPSNPDGYVERTIAAALREYERQQRERTEREPAATLAFRPKSKKT